MFYLTEAAENGCLFFRRQCQTRWKYLFCDWSFTEMCSQWIQSTMNQHWFSHYLSIDAEGDESSYLTNDDPDDKVQRANIGPTWVLSAPVGPHVGLMNLAIRGPSLLTHIFGPWLRKTMVPMTILDIHLAIHYSPSISRISRCFLFMPNTYI